MNVSDRQWNKSHHLFKTYFTAGPDEVIKYDDFVSPGSENAVKEAGRARYALLKTYVKANLQQLVAGDSSLIDIAVDYYEDKGMADEAAMASFYKADITYSAGDYAGAMRHALKSLEWNENACNQRFRAKTYDLISDIHSSVFNYEQGAAYGIQAARLFSKCKLRKNQLYSLIKVANAYAHDDFMEDKAVELLDSLQENFRDADSTALGMLHYRYRYPLNLSGRHQDAYNHYRKALSYWNGEDLFDNKPFVAKMFTNIGMYDSAAYYLGQERMINPDYDNDLNYHSALLALADSLGDVALYNKEVRRVSELERENVRFAMRDEVSLIERDFEHDRAEREHLKKERNKLVFIFAGIFTVVVGLLLIVIKMLTYLVAGFSMRTVCLFCGLKEDNNYARKKRLMDRLKQTDPEGYDILQRILKRSPAERLASL